MNRIPAELKLFRHLVLTPINVLMPALGIPLTAMAAYTELGWQRWVFIGMVLINLLNLSPDFRGYQALNLSRTRWGRHKQMACLILGLLMLLTIGVLNFFSPGGSQWILVGGILAVLAYRLIRLPQPAAPWVETPLTRVNAQGSAAADWLAMTPVNQIIRAPQLKTWLSLWVSCLLAVLVIDLLNLIPGVSDVLSSFPIGLTIVFLGVFPVMKAMGESLDTWVLFGGSRIRWARHTALIGLSGPVMVGIAGALYIWVRGGGQTTVTVLVLIGTALVFPVLSILVELGSRGRTWWVGLGFAAVTILLLVLLALKILSGGAVLGLFLLQYLGFALVLPQLALRHIPFSGGIRGWFGLKIGSESR